MNGQLYEIRGRYQEQVISSVDQLPSPALQALSLEYKSVVADYLLLKTMTFVGKKLIEKEDLAPSDWQLLIQLLHKITDLDPQFWDPYLLGETMLTWQAGMIDEANTLLLKAAQHNKKDFRPWYFLGFNHFYFKQNFGKAAQYIGEAATRPGAPYYFKGLAARLGLYGDQTDVAIVFLEDMLREVTDENTKIYLEKRLAALNIIFDLEKKVREYQKAKGALPDSLSVMVDAGLLQTMPKDPYGGEFFMMANGRVYTTSKLVDVK